MTTGRIIKFALVLLSMLFYTTSLFLPVFTYPTGETIYIGIECLLFGWLSVPFGIKYFAAYVTNFIFFISLPLGFFRVTGYVAIGLMVLALVMGAMVFGFNEVVVNMQGDMSTADKESGLYLWYLSYIVLFISLFIPAKWKIRKVRKWEINFERDLSEIY